MVIGVGVDLVQIPRIANILKKYPKLFPRKILGLQEKKIYQQVIAQDKINYLAKRFSAKESLIKAVSSLNLCLGFQDTEVLNTKSGKPFFKFKDNSILNEYQVDISISDDYPCAISFVIISSIN